MKLHIRKSTEINIQRKDTILFSPGKRKRQVEVAQGTVGNFDCTPYEPKNLEWGFGAELHQSDEKLWVRVVAYEQIVEIIDRKWVSRTEEEQKTYVSEDDGDTWTRYEGPDQPSLNDETRLDRVTSS